MSPLTNPRLHVTSKLMQDYRVAKPVTSETAISSFVDSNNNFMLFCISGDGNVDCIFSDMGSSTGWRQQSLGFLDFQIDGAKAKFIASGIDSDGTIWVVVGDTKDHLQKCQVVYGSQMSNDGEVNILAPGAWTKIPVPSKLQNYTLSLQQIKLGHDQDRKLLLTARLILNGFDDLYSIDFRGAGNPWLRIGYPIAGDDRYLTYKNISDYEIAINPPPDIPVGPNGVSVYQAADCIETPEHTTATYLNNLRISDWPSAADPAAFLYYPQTGTHDTTFWRIAFVPNTPSGETGGVCAIQLPDNASTSERTLVYCPIPHNAGHPVVLIGRDMKFTKLVASRDANGLAEVFALTASKTLFHVRQDPNNTASPHAGWQDGIEIMTKPQLTEFSLCRDGNRISHVFAVAADDTLYHIWQDKDSTDWNIVEIELQTTGAKKVEQFSSYWTEITVYDNEGAASANSQVKIFSDNEVFLIINGAMVIVDADTPWTGLSNASGQVVVSMKTHSLGTHALTAWTEFMPEADRVAIDPSGSIQTRLENLQKDTDTPNADTLLNAKVTDDQGNQTFLLKDDQGNRSTLIADALTDAIHKAMSLASRQPAATTETARYLHPKTNLQVASYVAGPAGSNPSLIHTATVPDQHWQISLSSGKPVFRTLNRDEAVGLIASGPAAPAASAVRGFGLPDIDLDWGDIVDAAEETVAAIASGVQDLIVSTVIDPVTQLVTKINARINLVMNGLEYVWNGAIEFVEQAYDLVVMVFNMVNVAFDDLFRWLGFIFNWPDILRAKDAVKHCVNQTFDMLEGILGYIKSNADNLFALLQMNLDDAFGQLINGELGNKSVLQLGSEGSQEEPPGLDESKTGNVFFTGFMNHASAGVAVSQLTGIPSGPFEGMISILTDCSGRFQASPEFTVALRYFQNAATQLETNPDAALQLTVAGVLSTLQGLARLGVELIRDIVNALLDALQAMVAAIKTVLNAPWNMPFVSDLYGYVTQGSQLTAIDLVSLIIAVPTTALYKIMNKQAPFPDQATVDQFESVFTAQAVLDAAGINADNLRARSPLKPALSSNMHTFLIFMAVANIIGYFVYGATAGVADAQNVSTESAKATNMEAGLSMASIISELVIFGTSCPYQFNRERPWLGTTTETSNLIWIFLAIAPIVDIGCYIGTMTKAGEMFIGKKASLFGNTGVVINIILGVGYLGLFGYLIGKQIENNEEVSPIATSANILSVLPLVFKFLRFFKLKKVLVPLAFINFLSNATAGILYMVMTYQLIDEESQQNSATT